MPQLQLPLFPHGTTEINNHVGFRNEAGQITYIYGHLPIFTHAMEDTRSFKLIISQLYVNGTATQAEISRAFGVTMIFVKRAVKCYRAQGAAGFFVEPSRRGATVLTAEKLAQCQGLLEEGKTIAQLSEETGVKKDTLRKAVNAGKLRKKKVLKHKR